MLVWDFLGFSFYVLKDFIEGKSVEIRLWEQFLVDPFQTKASKRENSCENRLF